MRILKTNYITLLALSISLLSMQCKEAGKKEKPTTNMEEAVMATIVKSDYGTSQSGEKVESYKLKNAAGMEVDIITYGGRITNLSVPDNKGAFSNVVLNFNSLQQYEKDNPFFGALIGRFGNRIAKATFSIDDKAYPLAANDGDNSLHGGVKGFDKVVWTVKDVKEGDNASLTLTYLSKDMEEGFPGNLAVTVIYTLSNDNTLEVAYSATTDKKTVINLTQHAYFNLSGDFSNKILDHELTLDADAYLPVDATLIPTGEIAKVAGTPFDFTTSKTVGKEIEAEDDQLKKGLGYDHCWVLNNQDKGMRSVALVKHASSGRTMEVLTTEPAMQFYTGNFLDGTLPTNAGGVYEQRTGFCLETQHYPDAPNQEAFPSTLLSPGETYSTKTTFKFAVNK